MLRLRESCSWRSSRCDSSSWRVLRLFAAASRARNYDSKCGSPFGAAGSTFNLHGPQSVVVFRRGCGYMQQCRPGRAAHGSRRRERHTPRGNIEQALEHPVVTHGNVGGDCGSRRRRERGTLTCLPEVKPGVSVIFRRVSTASPMAHRQKRRMPASLPRDQQGE